MGSFIFVMFNLPVSIIMLAFVLAFITRKRDG